MFDFLKGSHFCTNNKPKIKFYDLKKLNEQLIFLTYEKIVELDMLNPDEKEEYYCVPTETSDPHNYLYASCHSGFLKMFNENVTIIKINSKPNGIKLNDVDLKFIKDDYKKYENFPLNVGYTHNFLNLKNILCEELLLVDKLNSIIFFSFFPYLDKNNYFYYTLIIGLKENNFKLSNLKFNSVKDVSLMYLDKSHLNYKFFKNLFNLENNCFLNKDYRIESQKLFLPDGNIKNLNYDQFKLIGFKCLIISFYSYNTDMHYYLGDFNDTVFYRSKGLYINYPIKISDLF